MASSDLMKSLELSKVCPTPCCSSPEASLSLLFFDLTWLRIPPSQYIFFYESKEPTATLLSNVLPKLKRSLSLTLDHFLPLAGHLVWLESSDKPSVEYRHGDGVSLNVMEYSKSSDFDSLCSDGFREAKLFYPLLQELQYTNYGGTDCHDVPVFAVQVTLFPNKGFSVGLTCHHAVFDGKSFYTFIQSWASICKNDDDVPCELLPIFDRKVVHVPPHLEGIYLQNLLKENGPNNKSLKMRGDRQPPVGVVLGTFKLRFSDLEKLKKSVRSQLEIEHDQKLYISTFTITCAITWVCLLRTHKVTYEKIHLVFAVDCRTKLDPVVPSNYFGNCLMGSLLDVSTRDLMTEDGVAIAAKAIARALKKLNGDILNGADNLLSKCSGVQSLYSVASSPRFEFYKVDFGWGRPKKVELVSIAKSGAFRLSDDRDYKGGIEISVALKEHEAEDFAFIFANELERHQNVNNHVKQQ